ncbi:MAG: starch-binding protein [Prevotella sp.]|nr:starch-binding protein [Prevotella sp.]
MKRKILSLLAWFVPMCLLADGWPANYGGVMLQGFYWDSFEDAKWTNLTAQADELSSYFSLIWVPNSGQTKEDQWNAPGNWGYENMGYAPVYWLKHNTCFGTQTELMQMINTFKVRGTGIIEDVVINHKNGLTNWADFPNETAKGPTTGKTYTLTWCTDMQNLWGICSNDEVFADGGNHGGDITYVCSSDAAEDEADNFDGCRDLDHTDARVQQNVCNYLDFLLDELGYAGFRYDMVKGYKPYYTGLYNKHAKPEFSVGEYWDGSYDKVVNGWLKQTGIPADGEVQSAAFDFPLKFSMNNVFNNGAWTKLYDKGVAGDPNWSRYAVTFVDNHDTYRDEARISNNVLAANAFILAMPGTPCVFLPHWKKYKPEIKKMIAARKAAGITNESPITAQYDVDGIGYYLKVTGTKGSIILTLGNLIGHDVDTADHKLVLSGDNFALYLWNEVYDEETYEEIDAESVKDITVYVKDNGQGAPYLYLWNGDNQINGGWPGKQMTETATLDDGTSWYKQTVSASSFNAIVTYNNGNQTNNIERITEDTYICYYADDYGKYADYTPLYKGDGASSKILAYFDAPAGWKYAWAWCSMFYDIENKNYTGGEWPGQEMTKVGKSSSGNDIYCWSIDKNFGEGVPDHIIFNGNGQTDNLDFVNAAYYDVNGIVSKDRLDFYPTVLQNATIVSGVNQNGETSSLAQADANTALIHTLYYPAGYYTVQAYVKGQEGGHLTLTAGTDGVLEITTVDSKNEWEKIEARCMMKKDGVLRMTLESDVATWQVGEVSILKNARILGDVNGDGSITVTDVTLMVDYILGKQNDNFIKDNADVNIDGTITITDVTALVNIILQTSAH